MAYFDKFISKLRRIQSIWAKHISKCVNFDKLISKLRRIQSIWAKHISKCVNFILTQMMDID